LAIKEYLGFIATVWIVCELYLHWINYKGRFRYGLLEASEKKRQLQSRVGLFVLPISSAVRFVVVLFLSVIFKVIFNLSNELALALGFSGLVGMVLLDISLDKRSVDSFEKYCLQCEHKEDCNNFLAKKCKMEFLQHRVKMAVLLEEKAKD